MTAPSRRSRIQATLRSHAGAWRALPMGERVQVALIVAAGLASVAIAVGVSWHMHQVYADLAARL